MQTTERNTQNLPISDDKQFFETAVADKLRCDVIAIMKLNEKAISKISQSFPLLLDEAVGRHYDSIAQRISKMSKSTEYAGYPEILATSFLLKKQFQIYMRNAADGKYELFSKLPLSMYEDSSPIMLLYDMDKKGQPGHFSAMIASAGEQGSSERLWELCSNVSTLESVKYMGTNTEQGPSFLDVISSAIPSCEFPPLPYSSVGTASASEASPGLALTSSLISGVRKCDSSDVYRGLKLDDARKFSWLKDAGVDKNGKKCVICKICSEFVSTSKLMAANHRVPPIASGCRYSAKVVIDHAFSNAHKAAEDASVEQSMFEKGVEKHPWLAVIANMDKELYKKLVVFTFDIYNDARTGTLSAWSWPSRHLTRSASATFLSNERDSCIPFTPSFADIQYLNPSMHKDVLHCIAEVGREKLASELSTALAVSLSYDGSVDAYQEDSKYVGVRYVTSKGDLKAKFLGTAEPTERVVNGALGAIKTVLDESKWSFASATKVVTGFTTDGESLNTGCKSGLWVKLQNECSRNVMCIWCACHRSSLAYKSMFKEVDEVRILLQDCRSVATFFRTSGIRTLELNKTCESMSVKFLHFPQFKEVRMTEFTCDLVATMIRNLPGCLKYWQQRSEDDIETSSDRRQMHGFLRTWSNVDKLKLLHTLFDASEVVERLQKRLQFTFANLEDVSAVKTWALTCLEAMLKDPVSGGKEESFLSSLTEVEVCKLFCKL